MRRFRPIEVLPEILSELVFIALLVVGVMLFFVWVTRARPRPVAARAAATLQEPRPIETEAGDAVLG